MAGTPIVLRGFAPGPQPWSPGHRGVDVTGSGRTGSGVPVLAAGTGTVAFSGMVAGRGVVVIRHAGELRTTYEPVRADVAVGRQVVTGERIGSAQPGVRHCAQGPCLHWGALVGDHYLDPLSLLAGPRRPPVLLPLSRDST